MPRTRQPIPPAGYKVSWSDCKINALLDIIAQNPEWTQLCLGERVAKSEGKKLHAALLAISVELFDSSDPLWFDDMQARGLIRLDKLSKVWKATTLLSDTNVFQVYRKVRRLRDSFKKTGELGIKEEWQSWADVKAAKEPLYSRMQSDCPFYFALRPLCDLAASSADTSRFASPSPSHSDISDAESSPSSNQPLTPINATMTPAFNTEQDQAQKKRHVEPGSAHHSKRPRMSEGTGNPNERRAPPDSAQSSGVPSSREVIDLTRSPSSSLQQPGLTHAMRESYQGDALRPPVRAVPSAGYLDEIDWIDPRYTHVFLKSLFNHPHRQSIFVPDLNCPQAGQSPGDLLKAHRGLYIHLKSQEVGQRWLLEAQQWGWVAPSPEAAQKGVKRWTATASWPSFKKEVYGLEARLNILRDSWNDGTFGGAFELCLGGCSVPNQTWGGMMLHLFGPPGQAKTMPTAEPSVPSAPMAKQAAPQSISNPRSLPLQAQALGARSPVIELNSQASAIAPLSTGRPLQPFDQGLMRSDYDPTIPRQQARHHERIRLADDPNMGAVALPSRWLKLYDATSDRAGKNEIFEMGRAEIVIEAILCLQAVKGLRKKHTLHQIGFDLETLPSRHLTQKLGEMVISTGGDVQTVNAVRKLGGTSVRFEIHLFPEFGAVRERAYLAGRLYKVGLMEYLRYLATWRSS